MIKEIKYNGYTATPSDYESPDGDLAGVLNLVPEDGSLRPVLPPRIMFKLKGGFNVLHIHQTSRLKYYIAFKETTKEVAFVEDNGGLPNEVTPVLLKDFSDEESIYKITSIGNTLIVLASSGMHYFLWKKKYIYLGTHIPELPISFGLQGEMLRSEPFDIEFPWPITFNKDTGEPKAWDENVRKKVSPHILAQVNKFIAEKSVNSGKFIYPFLVRYAYRLYDGTITMHSSPVLMICSSDITPAVFWEYYNTDGKTGKVRNILGSRIVAPVHQLDYAVPDTNPLGELKKWGDIVKSVDIFISKPIYTYDQNGECQGWALTKDMKTYSVCKHVNQQEDITNFPLRYQKRRFQEMYSYTFNAGDFKYDKYNIELPRRTEKQIEADIRATSQFFLIQSIKLDDLKTSRTIISIDKEFLQSLVNRESMSDDYDSHDELIPSYSFPYNQRLNIANLKKRLYNKLYFSSLFCYTDGSVGDFHDQPLLLDKRSLYHIQFFIQQGGQDIAVESQIFELATDAPLLYISYPNSNATSATIWENTDDGMRKNWSVSLEPHPFLNMAFAFVGWDNPQKTYGYMGDDHLPPGEIELIDLPNKIYTSKVNNPFVFPVTHINTVGTGRIIGVSTAARALSQGQFGQFPLYAFTTEGVWALEVSTTTGAFSARQPITRDVCTNADSITQIDSAVLFTTDRGIMLLSGSTSLCLSEAIDSNDFFSPLELKGLDMVVSNTPFTKEHIRYIPFKEFLLSGGFIYDYTHQRIIVFNKSCAYAYVYSLKDKLWGMISSTVLQGVNSYPDAMAMDKDGHLLNFSTSDSVDGVKALNGLLITRPLKLDNGDILKTIDTIIQRGDFEKSHVQQILYGSRDLIHWMPVWSSKDQYLRGFRGTPYKYFRIVVIEQLDKTESIFGASIQHTLRQVNQPR